MKASVAALTEEMAAQSIAYHTRGTADSDKFCCYPWLVCHDSNALLAQAHPHDDDTVLTRNYTPPFCWLGLATSMGEGL